MTMPTGLPALAMPARRVARAVRGTLSPRLAQPTLGLALALAVSADTLLAGGLGGAAFPVWIAMTALSLAWLATRSDSIASREAIVWLVTAVLFSLGLAWRDSGELQALDFLGAIGALLAAAAALNAPRSVLFAPRLRRTTQAVGRAARSLVTGFPVLVFREAAVNYDTSGWALTGRRALRVIVVGGALALVFGSLLGSADPIFASFVTLPRVDVSVFVRHAFVVAVLAWTIGGWARGALIEKPLPRQAIGSRSLELGSLEITTAFVTLIVLFSAFIVAQLGWMFGGEAFLQARTGLTAAAYARQGFFQMVWVVLLVIPLLVTTRSALRPTRALARRHSLLAVPVVALLGAIVLSAMLRMRLYVHYYGLSTDRVYPLVFMAWLTFVLLWLSVTTLRGRARRFGPGVMVSALATLAGLNAIVPDAVVARVNVARSGAPNGPPLDTRYLAMLSGEAAEPAVQALLADARRALASDAIPVQRDRCATLNEFLGRWGAQSEARVERAQRGAWRTWNAGEVYALRVVARHEAELKLAQRDACTRAGVTKASP